MTVLPDESPDGALEREVHDLRGEVEKLRDTNARLKELDQLKDDFVSMVAHELRAPLTSIRASSEILHDNPGLGLEQRQKFLRIVIQESQRLTRLLERVLDLARIESGRIEWHLVDVDVAEVLNDALDATAQLFAAKQVSVRACVAAEVPRVRADRDGLMQVLVNLLSNAAKFAPGESGRVVVTVQRDENAVRVEVADNGPGVAPDKQRLIFEKFRQLGDRVSEAPRSIGLGLAISRRIVELFGGHVWLRSELGSGATFGFDVPIAADASGGVPPSAEPLKAAPA